MFLLPLLLFIFTLSGDAGTDPPPPFPIILMCKPAVSSPVLLVVSMFKYREDFKATISFVLFAYGYL